MGQRNDSLAKNLAALHTGASRTVPHPSSIPHFIEETLGVLFPQLSRESLNDATIVSQHLERLTSLLHTMSSPVVPSESYRAALIEAFINELPHFHTILLEDALAIFNGDPAARGVDEVIVAYPGFFAIAVYRLAHWFYIRSIPFIPRMIAEHAHTMTGIDIHPGATIGRSFVIDHGTGIVIGETTTIHDNVKMYQGVTLGALSVEKSMADTKRHPTIESDVVIYANATILGGETVIGTGSIIGGNVWLTKSVPPQSRIYHR
jgi:serine O-acetyltransferase